MSKIIKKALTVKQQASAEKLSAQLRYDELLLSEVQNRPILYDVKLGTYKDVAKRRAAWAEVAKAFGDGKENGDEAQVRFSYLRREYSRIKRECKLKSGDPAVRSKLERLDSIYRVMGWLDPFIKTRETVSNVSACDEVAEVEDVESDTDPDRSVLEISNTSSGANSKSFTKRRVKDDLFDTQMAELLKGAGTALAAVSSTTRKDEDECGLFAKSVAEGLRGMEQHGRRYAMLKIQEIMYQLSEPLAERTSTSTSASHLPTMMDFLNHVNM